MLPFDNMQLSGKPSGLLHQPSEREYVNIVIRQSLPERADINRLLAVRLAGADGGLLPLSELVPVKPVPVDQSIYRKNLMPMFYVIGDVAGEVASLLFSRMTVPILYFLDKRWEAGHLKPHDLEKNVA